ncbi:ribonuclease T [Sessilibacter corallicola]|uniref:Ribonuclease T n=1 Tax=Sessilibacter corallicola TaxID=2904075 RepID=A0ABQ0A4C7_9GAMM|nr:ribonuclease T [Sessilibacter corallicola]
MTESQAVENSNKLTLKNRFRGFLPVVVDVETGGFNSAKDALLEIAAVPIRMDEETGLLAPGETAQFYIEPFDGANIEQSALDFTGIDLDDPNRLSEPESMAIPELFKVVRKAVKESECTRAVIVGHNAHFDLGFVNAAADRNDIKRNPFHPFSCFDTATLAGLAFGQTVLAKACQTAGIDFCNRSAHSAAYDAEKTAELFCIIVNRWQELGGWPLAETDSEEEE